MTLYFGLSIIDSIVLALLMDKELYVAQILELSETHGATVHLSLKRMVRNGFITSHKESRESKQNRLGAPRYLYKPTPIGKRLYKLQQDTQAFLEASK